MYCAAFSMKRKRLCVTVLVVVVPRNEAVLAHHDGADGRILLTISCIARPSSNPGRIQGT